MDTARSMRKWNESQEGCGERLERWTVWMQWRENSVGKPKEDEKEHGHVGVRLRMNQKSEIRSKKPEPGSGAMAK